MGTKRLGIDWRPKYLDSKSSAKKGKKDEEDKSSGNANIKSLDSKVSVAGAKNNHPGIQIGHFKSMFTRDKRVQAESEVLRDLSVELYRFYQAQPVMDPGVQEAVT